MRPDENKKRHIVVCGKGGGNENVDWDDIQNKPNFATVATTGDYDDLIDKPTIPEAPVQSDWNEADSGSLAYIANKPSIPIVPPMATETLTFTLQDSTTKTITFFTAITGYFYIEDASGSDNTLSIVKNNENASTVEVFASTDQMSWTSMGSTSTTAITATIPANGKLYLKANADVWGGESNANKITCSGNHNVGGNIMSLLYGDNFSNQTAFPENTGANFGNLFSYNNNLISAENLILPVTTLPSMAYIGMFSRCTALTTAPATLPATTIGFYSCAGMFSGCSSLTAAPEMSAITVGAAGCTGMFEGCTALTTAPPSLGTTFESWAYSHLFENCTALTTAPELPATTLVEGCYAWMFRGCPHIDRVVSFAQNIYPGAMTEWLSGASATGDFYNLGGATYESGVSGIPSGWTEHNSL